METGTGDDAICLRKDVAYFVIIHVLDIERDHREIGCRVVENDIRILSEFPDEVRSQAPAFIGDCILPLSFDVADAGKERGNTGIVRVPASNFCGISCG